MTSCAVATVCDFCLALLKESYRRISIVAIAAAAIPTLLLLD